MHDKNRIEQLLMFICAEAATLRAELAAIADELHAEELNRFEGTLSEIQEESAALLMALPATVN